MSIDAIEYPDSALRMLTEHCTEDPRSARILYLLAAEAQDPFSTDERRARAAELLLRWLDTTLPDVRRLIRREGRRAEA